MKDVQSYIESGKNRFLAQLIDFLKIQSISNSTTNTEDVKDCSQWLAEHLKEIGFKKVTIEETHGHPIVYAEWLEAADNMPTVLIYGHYDVQPVDPIEEWDTPPFEPRISNGKIFARGTSDDKGQVFCHLKSIEAFFRTYGKLPINIKLLIEGEEECGSNNLDTYVKDNTEKLKCDYVLVSDTEWFADGLPSICYALRGIAYFEICVTGPNRDLHSGTFGGGIENPINALCSILSQLVDENGRITIKGFYDDVLELSLEERQGFAELPFSEEEYCKDLDISKTKGEIGFNTLERVWSRPSFDINGIYGGFTGDGAKTVIPSKATAKFSSRLVPNQNNLDIAEKVIKHIKEIAPETVKVEVKYLHGGNPALIQRDNLAIRACQIAFEKAFGTEAVFMREGGSIPIVGLFGDVLKAPTVLMGLGLPGDNIHSPNENFDLSNFYGGILTSAHFLNELSQLHKK